MEKNELEKFAELLISMSTDFLLGKITEDHYKNMIDMINRRINDLPIQP